MLKEIMRTKQLREIWIDNIKVFACVLVVLGHFFQSMIKANVLSNNELYQWFNQSIYFFHVPLFFICSGYIYQKYSKVESVRCWGENVLKKLLSLGIPYFAFSLITWLLKNVFSSSVNEPTDGLFQSLFVNPMSPYWYLYCLFLIFLITPTFKNRKMVYCGIIVTLILKIMNVIGVGGNVYAITIVFANEIWFVIGMCLCVIDVSRFFKKKASCLWGIGLAIIFGVCSVVISKKNVNEIISFFFGMLACIAVVLIIGYNFKNNVQKRVWGIGAKYTMPIFLMHTIFAAALRSVLFKFGISNSIIHVILGLIISFGGPIIAAEIMCRFKVLEFFLYPTKYVNVTSKTGKGR